MTKLETLKADYARVYGTPPPCRLAMHSPYRTPDNFIGTTIAANGVEFMFKCFTNADETNIIEGHFRDRLCRKIGFITYPDGKVVVMMSEFAEELDEWFTAVRNLFRYFRGMEMSEELKREVELYAAQKPWR